MCTIETLKIMSEISSLIMKLYASRLLVVGGDFYQKMSSAGDAGKTIKEKGQEISGAVRQNVNDAFRKILLITKENDRKVKDSISQYLSSLKEIFTEYPDFQRFIMPDDLEKQYNNACDNLRNKKENVLLSEIASCKDTLYTERNYA